MLPQRYSPRNSFPTMFEETTFDNMFSNLLSSFLHDDRLDLTPLSTNQKEYSPSVYTHTHDNEYIICAELPGYDNKNLKVNVSDETIQITGSHSTNDENGSRLASFYREFSIPNDVVVEEINAKLDKGILNIVLPRRIKNSHQIEIK